MTTPFRSASGPADGTGTDTPEQGDQAGAAADPDVIVLGQGDVTEEHDASAVPGESAAAEEPAATEEPAAAEARAAGPQADLSADWHDIQAMFVDDPQGSVTRAAEAAQSAAAALVDTLRQRQAALAPDAGGADTEQLRAALRSYRTFCRSMADISERITAA